tara:strand:+ start:23626 stop:24795 length:1170 start_codon:yes stop_codon:yes gene_type:complete
MPNHSEFSGPVLFSFGFRPFFLSAMMFAMLVIPIWWFLWQGDIGIKGPFAPADWHIHEMVFGYAAAVLAGFLFTAVPNWTGRLPTTGWPLATLLVVWMAGRIASAGVTGLPPIVVAIVDQLFLMLVVAMIAREILAGKNWRNLKVLVPVSCLWITNIFFHVEAATQGTTDYSRRLSLALLIFLVMLIGGRIVPSFTRNWLARQHALKLPTPFNRFDTVTLGLSASALVTWVVLPFSIGCAVAALLAAGFQLVRLFRWRGWSTIGSPLLVMLHVAYAMIPLGLIGIAAGAVEQASPAVGIHLLGIGAVGGMTVAVMIRATMGHTGRDLNAGLVLTTAFGLLILSAILRASADTISIGGRSGVELSALFWVISFMLVLIRIGPWLVARSKK